MLEKSARLSGMSSGLSEQKTLRSIVDMQRGTIGEILRFLVDMVREDRKVIAGTRLLLKGYKSNEGKALLREEGKKDTAEDAGSMETICDQEELMMMMTTKECLRLACSGKGVMAGMRDILLRRMMVQARMMVDAAEKMRKRVADGMLEFEE